MEAKELIDFINNSSQLILLLAITIYIGRKRAIIITSIWRRINGGDLKFRNEKLENAANELIDLEKFQVLFPNLKFKNIHQITNYIDWCKNKKISLSEANYHHECIKYKRLENPSITASYPTLFNFEKYFSMVATLVLFFGLIATLLLPSLSGEFGRILVKTKKSAEYLYINSNGTFQRASISGTNWIVNSSECVNFDYKSTTISKNEYQSICKLVSNEQELANYFTNSRYKGRITATIFMVIIIPLIFNFLSNITRLSNTPEFLTHIEVKKMSKSDIFRRSKKPRKPYDNER